MDDILFAKGVRVRNKKSDTINPATEEGITSIETQLKTLNGLIPSEYDDIVMAYTNNLMTSATFKLGVTVVVTILMTYDGSGNLTRAYKA